MKLLVKRDDVAADSKDDIGRTPLSCAAGTGCEAVVKLLVKRDDVAANSKDSDGRTSLSWAAGIGHEAVVKLLVERDDVAALYATADACLISSTRDGLNMVSYEYVACQRKRKGVLVMSQYTGAAKMLPSSVLVNPWDTPRFAETIAKVLEMPMEERTRRQDDAAKVVDQWTR